MSVARGRPLLHPRGNFLRIDARMPSLVAGYVGAFCRLSRMMPLSAVGEEVQNKQDQKQEHCYDDPEGYSRFCARGETQRQG